MTSALVVEVGEPLAHDPWFTDWLQEQGIDPRLTFKVEFMGDEAMVRRYKAGEDGKPFVLDAGKYPEEATHPEAGEVAVDEPLRVSLTEALPDRIATAARQA